MGKPNWRRPAMARSSIFALLIAASSALCKRQQDTGATASIRLGHAARGARDPRNDRPAAARFHLRQRPSHSSRRRRSGASAGLPRPQLSAQAIRTMDCQRLSSGARYNGDRIFAIRRGTARRLRSDHNLNGVSDQTFAPRPLRLGSSHVGIIGRIAPEKGQLDFIEAARAISRSGRHVRVSVFGAGLFSDPQYEKQLRRAAADSEIEFRGWADPVSAALNEIDVLAVPSNGFEATPRVIMEAFSAGTPVVAYPSGGIRELIRDGETGVLTCSATSDSLARSLADLLNKPELMAKLSAAGRREWETRFQRDRQVGEICDLLWRVHAKQSRQSGAAPAIACVDDVA